MSKIFITGGSGFIGSRTAEITKSSGNYIIGMGHGRGSSFYDGWFECDLTLNNLENLLIEFPDVIIHCAGNVSVGDSLQNPLNNFYQNVQTTIELLEYMRIHNPKSLLIFPSSAAVYGQQPDQYIQVTNHLNPVSPYGYYKKLTEDLLKMYSELYGLRIVIVRLFSVYGPGLKKQLPWDAANKILSENNPIFWGTGEEKRDWLYIDDACDLLKAISVSSPKNFTIINGGSGISTSNKDMLNLMKKSLGSDKEISFNGTVKEGDPLYYKADIKEALNFSWVPKINLEMGIKNYTQWFTQQGDLK